jgi:hypothetical protein
MQKKSVDKIPSWVDPDYGYDPQNPRKPNMRELMEAMSGKNVEDLYAEPNENWQKISRRLRKCSMVLSARMKTLEIGRR